MTELELLKKMVAKEANDLSKDQIKDLTKLLKSGKLQVNRYGFIFLAEGAEIEPNDISPGIERSTEVYDDHEIYDDHDHEDSETPTIGTFQQLPWTDEIPGGGGCPIHGTPDRDFCWRCDLGW